MPLPVNLFNARRLLATACLSALCACSMKPEAGDIERYLASEPSCPHLENANVEKTNGAPAGENYYDVAFTYEIRVKGGAKEAISKYEAAMREMVNADAAGAHWKALAQAHKAAGRMYGADDDPVARAVDAQKRRHLEAALAKLPCPNDFEQRLVRHQADALTDGPKQRVAFGIRYSASGRMRKTEAGWNFEKDPSVEIGEPVFSEPMDYPELKATYVRTDSDGPAATPAAVAGAEVEQAAAEPVAAEPAPIPAAPLPVPVAQASVRPSFDCAKASTRVEQLICGDPALAAADVATTAAFKAGLTQTTDQSGFRKLHVEWRTKVRDACADASCVANAYRDRLAALK